MWATGRYTFGLSEEEFWEMSPGMWFALHDQRFSDLKVFDAFQARISTTIASTVSRKSKKKIKESDFRLFPDKSTGKPIGKTPGFLDKMRAAVAAAGIEVRRGDG